MMCCICSFFLFFFKQKTAYEMRISDWSSDVCSSDLIAVQPRAGVRPFAVPPVVQRCREIAGPIECDCRPLLRATPVRSLSDPRHDDGQHSSLRRRQRVERIDIEIGKYVLDARRTERFDLACGFLNHKPSS